MAGKAIGLAEAEKVVRQAVKKEVRVVDFKLVPFEKTVGFMGEHCTLAVHYAEDDASTEVKETTFFVKQLPEGHRYRKYILGRGLFAKEEEMYLKLLPMMENALKQKMPVADCYLSSDENYMIFEDLSRKGFKMPDKFSFLQLDQCKAAFKALAMLHAGSLAVEIKTRKTMPEHAEHCYEALIADNSSDNIVSRQWHSTSLQTAFSLLQKMLYFKSRLAAVNWDDVHERLEHAWELCAQMANGKTTKYTKVISHGDLWVNNVLFRHLDVMLVDFQIYRYVPPTIDLLMLLHLTTSRQLRRGNQSSLIEFYFNCLVEYLMQAGTLKEEIPLSLEELLKSAEEFKIFGIVIAARYLQTCLLQGLETEPRAAPAEHEDANSKQAISIDKSDVLLKVFASGNSGQKFEARMMESFDDLLDHLEL